MSSHCDGVHGWKPAPDTGIPGQQRPVLCREYVSTLERALHKATGDPDAPEAVLRSLMAVSGSDTPAPTPEPKRHACTRCREGDQMRVGPWCERCVRAFRREYGMPEEQIEAVVNLRR